MIFQAIQYWLTGQLVWISLNTGSTFYCQVIFVGFDFVVVIHQKDRMVIRVSEINYFRETWVEAAREVFEHIYDLPDEGTSDDPIGASR